MIYYGSYIFGAGSREQLQGREAHTLHSMTAGHVGLAVGSTHRVPPEELTTEAFCVLIVIVGVSSIVIVFVVQVTEPVSTR